MKIVVKKLLKKNWEFDVKRVIKNGSLAITLTWPTSLIR